MCGRGGRAAELAAPPERTAAALSRLVDRHLADLLAAEASAAARDRGAAPEGLGPDPTRHTS